MAEAHRPSELPEGVSFTRVDGDELFDIGRTVFSGESDDDSEGSNPLFDSGELRILEELEQTEGLAAARKYGDEILAQRAEEQANG